MARPRALFLAPETPYPLTGGGSIRSASLLNYLAQGYDIDVVTFREPGAPPPASQLPPGLARRVVCIDLPVNRRHRTARTARNVLRIARRVPPLVDRFAGFEAEVTAALEGETYKIGVIEHLWCAPYWPQVAAACERTVLDLHNIESVLHMRCAEVEQGPTRLAHRIFARAARKLEQVWLPRFSEILTASPCDAALTLERAPGAHVTVYPNAIPLPPLPSVTPDEAVVFSGNLEYHPNISAVRFFREEVWPLLQKSRPGLVWRLVGKNPRAVARWTSGDPRIELTGTIGDAVAELARSKVAVVPILSGSGTRLKILEAWAAGLPVVSTRLGAEGLPAEPGRHLLFAENGPQFATEISRLLDNLDLRRQIGQAGRRLLEEQFTWETVWKNLNW